MEAKTAEQEVPVMPQDAPDRRSRDRTRDARTGAYVEATAAWQHEPAMSPGGEAPHRKHPARDLHRVVEEVRAELPDVAEVTVIGDPSAVLVGASRQADLLVVGTRGGGPLVDLVLGSVASDCVRRSACPVVVIPPGMEL